MKKIIIILSTTFVVLIIASIILTNMVINNSISVKRDFEPENIDELVSVSDAIIVGKVTKVRETVDYDEELTFVITDVEVKKTIKGELTEKTTIHLLQTKSNEDPLVEKNGQVLLFINEYVGPISDKENTYVCNGLYDGHYKIKGGKVTASYKKSNTDIFESDSNDIDSIEEIIYKKVKKQK